MKKHFLTFTICTSALLVSANAFGQGAFGGRGRIAHNLPPAQRLMEPGPGVGGPGPGVLGPMATGGIRPAASMGGAPGGPGGPGGYMAAAGGNCAPPMGGGPPITSQIAFLGPEGGEVAWDISGQGMFDSTPLILPGRQNFTQAAIYRLKLINLPDRPGVELYPTLEVAPVTPRTDAYLAHAPIPIQFTDEDLDQVLSGNFVTKVIYLPDPKFQELSLAGVETLVSTRLGPGVDPIAEADHRGSIMAILRIGNLDLQLPGQGLAMQGGVTRAQHQKSLGLGTQEGYQQVPMESGVPYQGPTQGEMSYGNGAMVAPQGMPTAGFAPQAMPPHMVSGMTTPQWGMPSVGTPIGLPGPPHIPLGHQAGLTSHTVRNRTRVRMPPPVHKMKINVKQRPGMSYPRPVNHVNIAENNRAGLRLRGGTVPPAVPTAMQKMASWLKPGCRDGSCR